LVLLFVGTNCFGQKNKLDSIETLEKKTELNDTGSAADYPELYKIMIKHPSVDAVNTKVILTTKGNVSFNENKLII